MPSHVGGAVQPALNLGVQIVIVQKCPAVEKTLPEVADRALNLAFGLGPICPAGPWPKAPVCGEAQELGVEYQATFAQPVVA